MRLTNIITSKEQSPNAKFSSTESLRTVSRALKLLFFSLLLVVSLDAKQMVNVNFSNLQINDFIKLISKITKKNILVSNDIVGTVNLISNAPIYDTELMGILISVLETKGYTLIEDGSILKIVRSVDAAKHNTKVIKQGLRTDGTLMVTQSIKIEGKNVDIVAAKIRYLISKTAKLMTMKESNMILITDYPKNIETIKKVIKDIAINSNTIIKVISIKNVEAKKIQTKLIAIAKSLFDEKIASQKINIFLDDNTNSIILIGIKQNVQRLEKLINTLDVESTASNGVKIYSLKNSTAASVLKSLNEIISKQTFADPTMKPSVSASEEINAIIAVGDPVVLKGIKLIIDELDREKFQVYVKARIIEINKKNSEDLGIKYGFDGAGLVNTGLYSLATNFGGVSPVGGIANLLASLDEKDLTKGFALGAAIDFLEVNGASKSISNPSILCVDNQESSIYVGKTISIVTGSTTVAGQTNDSYKREDVGLTLIITPRVSSSKKVTLKVEAILENVLDDGSNNGTGQPVTSKQEIKTQAILRHAESIVIGGLVKNYNLKSKSSIPLLSSIPIIGNWLFASTTTTKESDNLVVILTPYIIDKSEKLSQLQKDLGILANIQKDYNTKVFKRIEEKSIKLKIDTNEANAQEYEF
ncbi:MAG: hypothetical protein L3I99_05125 [Sulfurimonas sp.]|nr:hypothetical protein [Sulfurimonas sp.]